MISLKEVQNKSDLKKFVTFPFTLFKDNPYWIPPIKKDELNTFDPEKNPTLKNCTVKLFLAYKNAVVVGRVAAIINWEEFKTLEKKKTRFGWIDFIDDIDVSTALLDAVKEFGKSHQMEHMEGPLGFSNLDKVGVMSEGFDQTGTIITWYSQPYYCSHFEHYTMKVEKKYIESRFPFSNIDPSTFTKACKLIGERYQLRVLNFTKTSDIMPYVDAMFDLFNNSYAKLQSHVSVTAEQIAHIKKNTISFINPEYIKFIVDQNDKMIAFAIVLPNFAQAFQKANGSLFPFGWWHLLQAKKHSKEAVFYLIGITPEYQSKGVTTLIFDAYYTVFREKGITKCIRTPELEDNTAIHNLWKHFNPEIYVKRRTYLKMF